MTRRLGLWALLATLGCSDPVRHNSTDTAASDGTGDAATAGDTETPSSGADVALPEDAADGADPTDTAADGGEPADVVAPEDLASPDVATADVPTPDAQEPGPDVDAPPGTPPNIVVLMGEARGWSSTSTMSDPDVPTSKSAMFLTPHLDALAADGMTFSDFYAPSPRCMPSRAAYFTGRSPAQLHMTFIPEGNKDGAVAGNVVPPTTVTDLPPSTPTIASLLHAHGYGTAHFGKWHVGKTDPTAYGFDVSDGPTSNKGPAGEVHPNPAEAFGTLERAKAFIDAQTAAGKPFYVQISHYGGDAPEDSRPETYAAESARLAGKKPNDIGESAVIADMDDTVGQLLAHLEAAGLTGTTYVLFTADHGRAGADANAPLEQGKGSVWEGGIRVPLYIRGPGIAAGSRTSVRASQVDLLPTVMTLAGIDAPVPEGVEGGDLTGVLQGGDGPVVRPRDEWVVHFPHYDKDPLGPASAILLGDYKYIRFYEGWNGTDGTSPGSTRLYDLSQDLGEQTDLTASMPLVAAELSERLDEYLLAVGAQLPGKTP